MDRMMLRVPRSRGAISGFALILLGIWGSLIPFVGPYFHYAYTPDRAWAYTSGRFWLNILPGVITVMGGLIVLASSRRLLASFGTALAALAGLWFAAGSALGPAWRGAQLSPGAPVGSPLVRVLEQFGFYTILGVAIAATAAMAFGRLMVIGVRDAKLAERALAEQRAPDDELVSTGPVARVRRPGATALSQRFAALSRTGSRLTARSARTGTADDGAAAERISRSGDSTTVSR